MDQITQIKDSEKNETDELIFRRIQTMAGLFVNHEDKIQERFIHKLQELASAHNHGCLIISFLRSSYIVNSHEFYLAYYEKEPFVEEEPEEAYFEMKPVFYGIEEDFKIIDESLRKKYFRVFTWICDEIHRWYMEQIYMKMESILRSAVALTAETKGIEVYYGGYMEDLTLIGRI